MNLHVAKCVLVNHRLNSRRDRLPWFPASLYRSKLEIMPVAENWFLRPFRARA